MSEVQTSDLLSIGGLAAATGINVDTLRVWERRYGKPEPIRLPSGHRRYTAEHVRWARRVAEAIAAGTRTAKAVRASEEELDELLGPSVEDAPPVPEPEDLDPYVDAIGGYRDAEILARLWEDWRRLTPEPLLDRVLDPLLTRVGRAWADGDLDVRHEHFVSEILVHFLRAARLSLAQASGGPRILLTTLAGEEHTLGVQMAAVIATRRGAVPRILAGSTPTEEIVRAASEMNVDAVGISVSLSSGGVETDRELARLRDELPRSIRLVVGGAGARGTRRGPRGVEYTLTLGEFAEWLRGL